MKRLTHFDGGKWRLKIGDTEYSGAWVDRLAAYEETGLEPEAVVRAINDLADQETTAAHDLAELTKLCSYDRLRALAQADREGRCVVLPFKPPRRVYMCSARFPKPGEAYYASAINVLADMDKGCVFGDTPEEAEAALEGLKNG